MTTDMPAVSNSSLGTHGCPCITPSILLSTSVETGCLQSQSIGNFLGGIDPTKSTCLLANFGSSCGEHFMGVHTSCDPNNSTKLPEFCSVKWCFVDGEQCFSSNQPFAKVMGIDTGTPLDDLYYSISTCGNSFGKDDIFTESNDIVDVNFTVVVPRSDWPYFFLEDENGTIVEDFDDIDLSGKGSLHLTGILFDYFEKIKSVSKINSFKFVKPPKFLQKQNITPFFQAVETVKKGLADVSIGSMEVGPDILDPGDVTVPIITVIHYLYELQKPSEPQTLFYSLKKVFLPFTGALCFAIAIMVLLVAIINVYFSSPSSDFAPWHEYLRNRRWKKSSRLRRFVIVVQIIKTSFLRSFNECFSGSSEVPEESTLSHKFVAAGFGFAVLIFQSSYTANLATFLSYTQGGQYISSMQMAIDKQTKLCVTDGWQVVLDTQWPRANFVFIESSGYIFKAVEAMTNKKCEAIVAFEDQLLSLHNLCDLSLITNQVEVLTSELAFPIMSINKHIFDRAIFQVKEDTRFSTPKESYIGNNACGPSSPQAQIAHNTLDAMDLAGAMCILVICIVIALFVKTRELFKTRSSIVSGYNKEVDNGSTDEASRTEEIGRCNNDQSIDYVDLLELKYRIQLLTCDMQKAELLVDKKILNIRKKE